MSRFLVAVGVMLTLGIATAGAAPTIPSNACHAGAYALADGTQFILTPSDESGLRYRLRDGRTGYLKAISATQFQSAPGWSQDEPPPMRVTVAGCRAKSLLVQRGTRPHEKAKRIDHSVLPVHFASGDAQLYGELHLPASRKPHAVVVLQAGGSARSAVVYNYVQHLLPLSDIAVFVFDKRGTGRSTGRFTVEFGALADDVGAAVRQVRSMPKMADLPLGLMGESQGGWVVPLAATRTPVDFVIVSYGLAVSLREENRMEVMQGLQMRGYGADVQARAQEVVAATDRIMVSRFEDGLDDLRRLREAYGHEQWYRDLSLDSLTGDYTKELANTSDADMPAVKAMFSFDYDLDYDPLPTLRQVNVPLMWVLAGNDTEAPSESTQQIIRDLQSQGAPIDLAVFPHADHGMIEVESTPQGPKELDQHSPGYFELLADWIEYRKLASRRFGCAELTPRKQ
ncbi:alpha/beta hydrolase family protein [Steroidobacter cummioxidans]|uniref:alpha/beta hydrolase family protein n=1 Tax=Steroidobacter cummioxidans TaxID=1803913 RepID=UPI000E30C8A0|nr:alpha/beta hydrolase [Steroidobacter cummioxidans]